MAKKSKNTVAGAVAGTVADTTTDTAAVDQQHPNAPAAADPQQPSPPAAVVSSNSSDEGDAGSAAGGKRAKRAGPVDRLKEVVELLHATQQQLAAAQQQADGKHALTNRQVQAKLGKSIDVTNRVIATLLSAKVIPGKKSRSPNEYNQFVSSRMQSLKDSDMTSTEKFKHCIQLWNDHKLQQQQAAK